jgi:hypothetical protein
MPPQGTRATGSQLALLSLARLIARAALREVLASEANSGDSSASGTAQLTANQAPPEPQNLPQLATVAADAADPQGVGTTRGERQGSTTKAGAGESCVIQRGKTR